MASFTINDSQDNVTGTGANDVITGGAAALQSFDTIDGGGGFDRLITSTDPNGTQSPTIRNVEHIFLDTAGLPFDISNITGARRLIADGASIIFENVGTNDLDIAYTGRNVQSGTVDLRFEDGALEASNDSLKLIAINSNMTFTSGSTYDSPGGSMNQTEDADRIESINLRLGGSENQVDISDFASIGSFILSGTATSKVTLDAPDLARIDATETTGGITLTNDIPGDQTVLGGSGDDDFKTGSGDDRLRGGEGDDVLNAGSGDNVVVGGAGDDEITTEQGADNIAGGGGADVISAGSGDDTIDGGFGNDEITAGDGADTIRGGRNDDVIMGQGGADTIFDGMGADEVDGGGDNDTIIAGMGDDTFTGGGGVDTFRFTETSSFGEDTVTDFTLTSSTSTNDIVEFNLGGAQALQSQQDFQDFADANGGAITVDDATSTITIEADGGTIMLEVSDTDFLMV